MVSTLFSTEPFSLPEAIQDTEAEKERDMKEVAAGLMQAWEYRMRWYGEDERIARRNCAQGLTA